MKDKQQRSLRKAVKKAYREIEQTRVKYKCVDCSHPSPCILVIHKDMHEPNSCIYLPGEPCFWEKL
ncbi:MAG: hypothetical protein R6V50_02215 [Thermoplasmatota archaeon]